MLFVAEPVFLHRRRSPLPWAASAIGSWARSTPVLGPSPICARFIFLTWGEIFSLFPSTCTGTFGTKFTTANLSFLYKARRASAFPVPLANIVKRDWKLAPGFAVTAIIEFRRRFGMAVLEWLRLRYIAATDGRNSLAPTESRA